MTNEKLKNLLPPHYTTPEDIIYIVFPVVNRKYIHFVFYLKIKVRSHWHKLL